MEFKYKYTQETVDWLQSRIRELEAQLAIVQDTQTIPPSDGGEFERVLKTHRMPAGNYVFSTEGSIFGIDNLTLAYKSDCAANKQHIAELEAALATAQERNTALQSEHLDHVIRLYDQLTAANSEIEKLSALLGKDNKNGN